MQERPQDYYCKLFPFSITIALEFQFDDGTAPISSVLTETQAATERSPARVVSPIQKRSCDSARRLVLLDNTGRSPGFACREFAGERPDVPKFVSARRLPDCRQRLQAARFPRTSILTLEDQGSGHGTGAAQQLQQQALVT